ncbi:hypothetical protein [Catellatospora vulcania]|uniref:hypothetical protein n=1 Tax=Catellatospora vulcania TaxID=1460450 RepID=UPI0012D38617|nr:hypothetical protein [Catellatospora vulcania]
MTRTDADLTAVRDLPPGSPEPSDESVSRTWRLLNARHTTARTRSPRWTARRLVPAAAGLAVAAVALGVAVHGGTGASDSAAPDIAEIKASHQPLPSERGADPRRPRTTPEAKAALAELARTAERADTVTVAPGQFVHVRLDGWAAHSDDASARTVRMDYLGRELWLEPDGLIAVKITNSMGSFDAEDPGTTAVDPQKQRTYLREQGPSLVYPTTGWLADLPADDPAALLDLLRAPVRGNPSRDHDFWYAMTHFYQACDILLPRRLRAGLLRAFQGMDGLTVGEVTVDGTRLISVRHTDGDSAFEILFDPVTAWAVGRRELTLHGGPALLPPAPGPRFDPPVLHHAMWQQRIVGSLDEH